MGQPKKIKILTRKEYNWLKSFRKLEPHELKKIKEFEEANKPSVIDQKPIKKLVKPEKKKVVITKKLLWANFKIFYKVLNKVDFVENEDTIKNVAPIINYFAGNEDFFKSPRLITKYNDPSFNKSLLIIGMFGNGKSTIMKTLGEMFKHYQMPMKFRSSITHNLVTEFESLGANKVTFESQKYQFFHDLSNVKALYLDDVKKERIASNYGKVNLIREIIEKRSENKKITHMTMNFRETDKVGNIEDGLLELGEKYGGHVFDRIMGSCNIIEFKGKSFRR